eukprot:gnl/MRDRNA2_/MRDRNA2_108213_c0_seq1.p1 gnl/MRDRNA2_/MRDRNA2_108213_c0~~gnl/MRDRNA2_/MRDRNA2_108213_c0_seq1.p1  ORF type:complete len:215 (-),score=65.18 gnl/MRDRNA2_/MRDRNA2_108213_c0_seq1:22-666(-)
MGGVLACCEMGATKMNVAMMKAKMEGDRRKVEDSPETFVTIEELILKDDGAVLFSPAKFTLQGIHFRVLVEMTGTAAEISKEIGQVAAMSLMDKAGLSDSTKDKIGSAAVTGLNAVNSGVGALKDKMGKGGKAEAAKADDSQERQVKSFTVNLTVDMVKEFQQEVEVKITDLSTSFPAMKKALEQEKIRKQIEKRLSAKATQVASEKLAAKGIQ